MTKNMTKNSFFRFFAALCIIAMMLVITAGKCKPKGGNGEKKTENPKEKEDAKACTDGFKIEFAKADFAKAFTAGEFKKDSNNSFNATVDVNLNALTQANGFVSNHAWINPDKTKANLPFEDVGTYALAVTGTSDSGWTPGVYGVGTTKGSGFDYSFCGTDEAIGIAITSTTTADRKPWSGAIAAGQPDPITNLNPYFPLLAKQVAGGDGWAGIFNPTNNGWSDSIDQGAANAAKLADPGVVASNLCKDAMKKGTVIDHFGHALQGMYMITDNTEAGAKDGDTGATIDPIALVPSQGKMIFVLLESEIDKVGAYYIRRNANLFFDKLLDKETVGTANTGAVGTITPPVAKISTKVGDGALTSTPITQENDTDNLYDEVQDFFKTGGVAMAALSDVFDLSEDVTIVEKFTKQPKGTGDNDGTFSETTLGTVQHGGWQKLFTIKPCLDKEHVNGFAVAQYLNTTALATGFAAKPYMEYVAKDTTKVDEIDNVEKKVVLRTGAKAATNDHALIFDSVASPNYAADTNLGLFTVRHDDQSQAMALNKNAFSTKGMLICRSSLYLERIAGGSSDMVKGHINSLLTKAANKANHGAVAAYGHKMTGYMDAKKDDKTKGLGMTCYLGLSALWPDAIDGSDKAEALYTAQWGTNRTAAGYDTSDKKIGVSMISMPAESKLTDAAVKPLLIDELSADSTGTLEMTKAEAEAAFENLQKAESKVKLLHGVVTLKFANPNS